MLKDNKKSEKLFKNPVKKNHDSVLDNIVTKYDQTVEHGKQIGRGAMTKIEKTTKTGAEFIKSKHYWESLKNSSLKIKEKSIEQENILKKESPKLYKKISSGFFYFFEAIVGRIKIGTQYGNSSLELLEKLAKLKELGILNDTEFAKKKRKILDRI
ncbi:MAG: SHOCT domain-containing protein [Nitrosopumilus sp.]|nr:SHOCT domain-containing protein [Nitrosopumilus sp.]